ncbi:MAG: phospholipid carrier-dependent glycosyltransferase [Desulfobacterales bacterium]
MRRKLTDNTTASFLFAILLAFFCMEVVLNLIPPISRDALIHHLAVPKLWLKHGGIYEIPWANYAYYPMNIDLLYVLCLYFKNDIAPKFIHLAFGLGTGLIIYLYLKPKYSRNWGLLGAVIFITTPIVVWLSTTAYVDLGMTFFITASVMSFIRWRDDDYKNIKWLLLSGLAMGIAVGSKYNALIAAFILNMILMLSVVWDKHKQTAALWYGILFFVITAFTASPWYLKNYLQTGNPFYPLFGGFFKSLHYHPIVEATSRQTIEKSQQISFFKMREVMYGESFWETLLIPIRMFFQGKDNSYQYFQGALNPVLIIFSPFIFLNKRYGKDKFCFLIFTVFFIAMAFFLTAKQVRYILPVLPFLAVLAVMEIKNILDYLAEKPRLSSLRLGAQIKSMARIFVLASVAVLLIFNFIYLKNRIETINPFPYVLGKETREDFLKHHLLHYDAVEYINRFLPDDAVVFTMFLGRRGYYLNRNYKNEPSFGMNTLRQMVNNSDNENRFKKYVRSMGVTHILMRVDLVNNFLKDNFSRDNIKRFLRLEKKYWKKVYEKNGYAVWDIRG